MEEFLNKMSEFIKNIMQPMLQIEQLVRSPKIDKCREQLHLRSIEWIKETQKSTNELSTTVHQIVKELQPLIS